MTSMAGSLPAAPARDTRRLLVPTRSALVLAGFGLLLGIAASFAPVLQPVWAGSALLLVMGLMSDAGMAWMRPPPAVRRLAPEALAIGVEVDIEVGCRRGGALALADPADAARGLAFR